MFRRILVPIDSTAHGTEVADVARRLAERTGASLLLLHVAGADASAEDGAQTQLAMEKVALEAHGLVVESRVESGEPAKVISALANQKMADVIVLAPHQRGWLEALARPSVTRQLISLSRTPLLIWPGEGRNYTYTNFLSVPNSQVIVALDGSDLAEAALPHAAGLARDYARPLLLVRVVPPEILVSSTSGGAWFETEREEALETDARCYLRDVRHRLTGELEVPVTTMVAHGMPAHELSRITTAHDGSLLVMSTHGRSGLSRLLMGSVAARLAKDMPGPLLIVRPEEAAGAARQPTRAAEPTGRPMPDPLPPGMPAE